ncbi:MAG: DUF5715 family protein [Gemmatimonadetes bacterium]|nr:DUF5715 family protein [Candidatus Palauibacter rhopaloidicola]
MKTWTMLARRRARSLRNSHLFFAASALLLAVPGEVAGQSLRGSTRSLDRQNRVAREHDFTYIATPAQLQRFVDNGYLVQVPASRDYVLHDLSFPYARPEVKLFISRLARQYRSACGERLVVTSLTRPKNKQPSNASPRSVHPTGMALDLRRPDPKCRGWLERVLLQLEGSGVLEVTLERYPPHYHLAIFPQQYAAYVERITRAQQQYVAGGGRYRVRPGDSLWGIARRHDTTVPRLRSANNLSGSRIYPGQVLTLPD